MKMMKSGARSPTVSIIPGVVGVIGLMILSI